jgi:hypothetical protein
MCVAQRTPTVMKNRAESEKVLIIFNSGSARQALWLERVLSWFAMPG